MRRVLTWSAIACLLVVSPAKAAWADRPGGFDVVPTATGEGADIGVGVGHSGGSGGAGTGGGGISPWASCRDATPAEAATADGLAGTSWVGPPLRPGQHWLVCTPILGITGDQFVAGGGAPDVMGAVARARAALHVDVPGVHTAPPRSGLVLVGVEIWFWVDQPHRTAATAAVPGLSATVTATPGTTRVDTDDGTTLRCRGGGTPWDAAVAGGSQHSDCTHTYQRDGTRAVRVTVDWILRWTASDGQHGTLPPLRRTTTITLPVRQAQATTD